MAQKIIRVGDIEIANDKPMVLFGGMNVLESRDMAMQVCEEYVKVTQKLGIPYVFKAWAAIGRHGRTVGLVEAGLEYIRDAQLLGDPHIFFTDLHRHVAAFQYVHAAEQHHGLVVGNLDIAYANDLLGHRFTPSSDVASVQL